MRFLQSYVLMAVCFANLVLLAGCIRVKTDAPAENETENQQTNTESSDPFEDHRPKPGPVDEDAPEEFTELPSGLKYRILRKSDGETPKPGDEVTFHSIGKQTTGERFEYSYITGKPITLKINKRNLIIGLREALLMCKVGGMIEFEIPSRLAYGARGNLPKIPANSDLVYLIELYSIKSKTTPAPSTTNTDESNLSVPPAPGLPQ